MDRELRAEKPRNTREKSAAAKREGRTEQPRRTPSAGSAGFAGDSREARAERALLRKKRKRIRRIKGIWNGITTVLVAAALVLAILIWGLRLIGMDAFIIQSGSMEPEYKVGGLVYVNEVDPNTLHIGDVITFRIGEDTLGTHRIIEVLEENGAPAFRTKGDANEFEDNALVTPETLVGKVRFTVPELGFFVAYIQEPPGSYFAFCVVAMLLVLTLLPDILFEDPAKKQESTNKKPSSSRSRDRRASERRTGTDRTKYNHTKHHKQED